MNSVEIRNIRKSFGDSHILHGIDLTVKAGEFLVLLGPSGCGKSTLMRMIAGIETPTSGRILIGGRDVTNLPARSRNVAMVFQTYALYPHLSVRQNIGFPLKTAGMARPQIAERVAQAANMFKIGHLLERRPRQLSGGERQRVALARALVREPELFMLDEPLSNLDAKLRHSAREEIQQLQRQTGITTIYVTHDQVEAMALGHRVAVLCDGRLRQLGTPDEVYHRPADTFVATFVGSPAMNLVEVGDRLMGFRPEQFLPSELAAPGDAVTRMKFAVTRIENLGSDRLLYGTLNAPYPATSVIAELPAMIDLPFSEGGTYEFYVSNRSISYFDKESGIRVENEIQSCARAAGPAATTVGEGKITSLKEVETTIIQG